MRFRFLILLMIALSSLAEAQSFYAIRRNRDLMVNFGLGTTNYFGDFVNPRQLQFTKPNIVIGVEHFLSNRIAVRSELTWFQIAGNDTRANDDRDERNLSFRSNIYEFSTVGIVNLIPMGARFYQRTQLNFYGFAGIAVIHMNPKAEYEGKKYALQPLQTEGVKYHRIQPVIPFGLGAKIKYGPFFNILIEGGYRFTFTDYMDDVSKHDYVARTNLSSELSVKLSDRRIEGFKENAQIALANGQPELAALQSRIATNYESLTPEELADIGVRGNPAKNDGYFMVNVKVQYYLPYTLFGESTRKLYTQKRKAIYRKRRR